jgi:hypothetical protein
VGSRSTPAWASSPGASAWRGRGTAGCARRRSRCSRTSARGSRRSQGRGRWSSRAPCATSATSACCWPRNREATPNYSLHTTGWTFDVLRSYRSHAQALAFEFVLERLQSLDLIAWVREPAAIHVTVSSDAQRLVGPSGAG